MITSGSFIRKLLLAVPEARNVADDHLDDSQGELLLHLLMSDLLRLGVAAFEDGGEGEAGRLLAFIDGCLSAGDEQVANAVAVSFVEGYGSGPNEPEEFLEMWPRGLRAELGR